jgi:acyl carrier protein
MNSLIARISSLRTLATPQRCLLAGPRMIVHRPYALRYFSTSQQLNENEVIELVEGKIFEVLKSAAKCNHSKLARTASFEELGFDSLDGVELVLAMEEHFGFDLSNQDAEKINTVMDAIQIFHSYYTKRLQPAQTSQQ